MGNKPFKEVDSASVTSDNFFTNSRGSSADDFAENASGRALGRTRAGTMARVRVSRIIKQLNPRVPKKSSLFAQRYREEFSAKTVPVKAVNPRFRRSKKIKHKSSNQSDLANKSGGALTISSKHKSAAMPVTRTLADISVDGDSSKMKKSNTYNPEKRIKKSDTQLTHTPKPPSKPKIRARYAICTFVENVPFEKYTSKTDYRSDKFSALTMTNEELKAAAVEMILCTVNEDVFFSSKIKAKFHSKKSKNYSRSGSARSTTKSIGSVISASMRGRGVRSKRASAETELAAKMITGRKNKDGKLESAYTIDPKVTDNCELREAVVEFVDLVERDYTDTTYHCFKHAVDVTQMMFMMGFFLRSGLTSIHPFLLIITCLCHDVGHFGANNAFLKKMKPENVFVKRFSTNSPLERFHVFTFKKIVARSRLFSEEFMKPEVKEQIMETATKLILATDMEVHAGALANAKEDLEEQKELREEGSKLITLPWLVMAMKTCDVANVTRDFNDAKEWANVLSKEFQAAGTIFGNDDKSVDDSEVENEILDQIEISDDYEAALEANSVFKLSKKLHSRGLIDFQKECVEPDFADCAQLTLGFIKHVALPMVSLLAEICPQVSWILIRRMTLNMHSWVAAIKEEDEKVEESDTLSLQLETCQVKPQTTRNILAEDAEFAAEL